MTKEDRKQFDHELLEILKGRGTKCNVVDENGKHCLKIWAYENQNLAALVHLEPLYKKHESGMSSASIVEAIENTLKNSSVNFGGLRDTIDKSKKEKLEIFPVLRTKQDIAQQYYPPLYSVVRGTDLAVGWKVRLKGDASISAWLNENMKNELDISEKEMEKSMEAAISQAKIVAMPDDFNEMNKENKDLMTKNSSISDSLILWLSNNTENEGAAIIAFQKIRELLLKNYPGYRVVVPTSVNRLIILHEKILRHEEEVRRWKHYIEFGNKSLLDERMILSNNIYYIADDGALKIL